MANRLEPIGERLPERVHALLICVDVARGDKIAEAVSHDSAVDVRLTLAETMEDGFALLNEEKYDVILLEATDTPMAARALDGLRLSGHEDAVVVLGNLPPADVGAHYLEAGADAYLYLPMTTAREMLWQIARAIKRHVLIHENRRLIREKQERIRREKQEVKRLLNDQKSLAERLRCREFPATIQPKKLISNPERRHAETVYRELLRTAAISGWVGVSEDIEKLAEQLAASRFSAAEMIDLHIRVIERMICGLGNRSSRHLIHQADLLLIEALAVIGEHRAYDDMNRTPGESRRDVERQRGRAA